MQIQERKVKGARIYVITILVIVLVFTLFQGSKCDSTIVIPNNQALKASVPKIPDTVMFCGNVVPLEYFDVKESLERELMVNSYWHSQTMWLMQKSNRYFPIIEPILKEHNIPDDFKYIAVAESGLGHVVSPAGATGFWQILEGTATDYGLEVNDEVDERYHLEKSTHAACKYLQESYAKFGTWEMAAASYNVGRRGINRQIEKQKENSYYDLLLNSETARYVFRIIAFKLVFENPESYNFHMPEGSLYQPIKYKEVEVSENVSSWADFAHEHKTNYKMLKMLNPWLRDGMLTNRNKKTYTIKIPKKNSRLITN